MPKKNRDLLRFFSFRRIAIPVFIGLVAASYLFIRDFDRESFAQIRWASSAWLWLGAALILMAIRTLAYMYRIRLLTDHELSWRKSFQVIMLWEFASSITPSVVGGTAVALFIVRKEGISMGRTTSVVMITALLDELFYIIMVPVIILLVGTGNLFVDTSDMTLFGMKLGSLGLFVIGYVFILALTAVIVYGIFINPRGLTQLLIRIFSLKMLSKWLPKAKQTGNEIILTSAEMRGKSFIFWSKAFLSTFVSWTARFWVVNALILAFIPFTEHFLVYARQLIMWVILLISPTPGSSGVAEFFFPLFFSDLIGAKLGTPLALLWRLVSYYPFIFIGLLVFPVWIRRVFFGGRRSIRFASR